jgi:hypothetical protein
VVEGWKFRKFHFDLVVNGSEASLFASEVKSAQHEINDKCDRAANPNQVGNLREDKIAAGFRINGDYFSSDAILSADFPRLEVKN